MAGEPPLSAPRRPAAGRYGDGIPGEDDDWITGEGDDGITGDEHDGILEQHRGNRIVDSEQVGAKDKRHEPLAALSPPDRPPLVRGAREFARAHLAVIAVICAALLLFAGSQVLGARAIPVPGAPGSAPQGFAAGSPGAPSSSPPAHPAALQIHVTGAVRSPGVHALEQGARVADAIAAAGGLDETADIGDLNLAAPVCDGCQLMVGTKAMPHGELRAPTANTGVAGGSVAAGAAAGSSGTTRVNLNTADASALDALPGIGPVIANRIIEWRTEHSRFSRVEELQEVAGIGPALFEKVKDRVAVS